ncbi:MAG: hypothetical protein ACQEWU_09995 [Bacillota bacterium]
MAKELGIKNMSIIPQPTLEKNFQLLKTKELFQKVKDFIKNTFDKEAIFSEIEGLCFDMEGSNTKAELYILDDSMNFVSLSYGLLKDEDDYFFERVRFQVVIQENGETVIKKVLYNQETKNFEINTSELINGNSEVAWSIINKRNKTGLLEELKSDQDAVNEKIEVKGIFDFCLPGGYQYCGKGCGNCSGCSGGGSLKNKIDGCCFVHDDCYKKHHSDRCDRCDWALVSCVQNDNSYKEGPIAADSITLFFSQKCGYVI